MAPSAVTSVLRLLVLLAFSLLSAGPAVALEEPISKSADTFLQQGILGALVVMLAVVGWLLFAALRASWQARLDDQKAFKSEIVAANKDSADGLARAAAATADLTRAVEASNREGADRGRAITEGLAPLVPIQTGLAANGSAIGRVELDVRALVSRGAGA